MFFLQGSCFVLLWKPKSNKTKLNASEVDSDFSTSFEMRMIISKKR